MGTCRHKLGVRKLFVMCVRCLSIGLIFFWLCEFIYEKHILAKSFSNQSHLSAMWAEQTCICAEQSLWAENHMANPLKQGNSINNNFHFVIFTREWVLAYLVSGRFIIAGTNLAFFLVYGLVYLVYVSRLPCWRHAQRCSTEEFRGKRVLFISHIFSVKLALW